MLAAVALITLWPASGFAQSRAAGVNQVYDYEETRALVALVSDAAGLIQSKGDAAFAEFRVSDSRWRQGEMYIFVLDLEGNMLVHPDGGMEGTNQLGLKDVAGKPIIRGLIDVATTRPDKRAGWYHYQWPVPGGLLPRWKSSYVRLVDAPSGSRYIVGCGVYNDRMERAFVADMVTDAVAQIERSGEAAYPLFFDETGRFRAKDAYVWIVSSDGVDIANPAFPNFKGRNQLDLKDTQGKPFIREMLEVAQTRGSGWVDYMWPKPGESVSTQKSTYVSKATIGTTWVMVGSGVYLADAPRATTVAKKMTAPELMALVRDGAVLLEQRGEEAYPELRQKGSKWFRDDTYFMTVTLDGTVSLHAADPAQEGLKHGDLVDVLGRRFGRMLLDAAATPWGEGWVHYMYPEPGNIFPTWKSVFVKRVTFPSGTQYAVCSAIYNMQMDEAFIEDVVDRAAALIAARGADAFKQLRDKTGPFVFMDTYIFVDRPDGIEVVNPAQPSVEGTNFTGMKDLNGKRFVDEYIAAAMKNGSAWVDYSWYKPGDNTPAPKRAYVRKVQSGADTYIVGSGFYVDASATKAPSDESIRRRP